MRVRRFEIDVDADWVSIYVRDELQYAGSKKGGGMQCDADDGSDEWLRVRSICNAVRKQVLRLDRALDDLKEGME